jgi:hypothetical protein
MFMIFSNKNFTRQNAEAGVSLILSIMVLSAITAVAFSVATIVFIQLKAAGDSLRTEPALYATLGVTEEALFQYKRYINPASGASVFDVPKCEPTNDTRRRLYYNVCLINGVTLTMPGTQPIAYDDSPRVELLGAGVTKYIPMYQVNNFLKEYTYSRIDVLPNPTDTPIKVVYQVTQANKTEPDCDLDLSNTITDCFVKTVTPGTPYPYSGFANGQTDLILINPSTQDVSVSITTTRIDDPVTGQPALPGGLPFVGEEVLRIMADYVGLTRTYEVRIPIP